MCQFLLARGARYTGIALGLAYTWTTFKVASTGMMQWGWLSFEDINAGLKASVASYGYDYYYNYVFSNVPISARMIEPGACAQILKAVND